MASPLLVRQIAEAVVAEEDEASPASTAADDDLLSAGPSKSKGTSKRNKIGGAPGAPGPTMPGPTMSTASSFHGTTFSEDSVMNWQESTQGRPGSSRPQLQLPTQSFLTTLFDEVLSDAAPATSGDMREVVDRLNVQCNLGLTADAALRLEALLFHQERDEKASRTDADLQRKVQFIVGIREFATMLIRLARPLEMAEAEVAMALSRLGGQRGRGKVSVDALDMELQREGCSVDRQDLLLLMRYMQIDQDAAGELARGITTPALNKPPPGLGEEHPGLSAVQMTRSVPPYASYGMFPDYTQAEAGYDMYAGAEMFADPSWMAWQGTQAAQAAAQYNYKYSVQRARAASLQNPWATPAVPPSRRTVSDTTKAAPRADVRKVVSTGAASAAAGTAGPARVPGGLLKKNSKVLVVNPLTSGGSRIEWIVDAKRLDTHNGREVSPQFFISLCAKGEEPQTFQLTLYPVTVDDNRHGAGFKKAKGRGRIELKLLSCPPPNCPEVEVVMRIGKDLKFFPARGPITHHFTERSCCGMPRAEQEWDFKAAVDRSNELLVTLDLVPKAIGTGPPVTPSASTVAKAIPELQRYSTAPAGVLPVVPEEAEAELADNRAVANGESRLRSSTAMELSRGPKDAAPKLEKGVTGLSMSTRTSAGTLAEDTVAPSSTHVSTISEDTPALMAMPSTGSGESDALSRSTSQTSEADARQTVFVDELEDGGQRVRWTIDTKKLMTKKSEVSPRFDLILPGQDAQTFQLFIYPKTVSGIGAGSRNNFKNADSRARIVLKCQSLMRSSIFPEVQVRFGVGQSDEGQEFRAAIRHCFSRHICCGMAPTDEEWDLRAAVESGTLWVMADVSPSETTASVL